MTGHEIVVVGGSAGAVESSRALVAGLPADLNAAVFLVIHQASDASSRLARILTRAGPLTAAAARDAEPIKPGRIYIPPGDHHLLMEAGRVRVSVGPKHNHHRPAIDPLFRSASRAYGPRVIGVVLSGNLDDGSSGLATIRRRGGLAVVEQPETALFSGMPSNAIAAADPDHVVSAAEMGPLLGRLVTVPADSKAPSRDAALDLDYELYLGEHAFVGDARRPSPFSCPECGGVLWEGGAAGLPEYQCRVGHSFTAEGLASEQNRELEHSLWAGIRSLEEHAQRRRRMEKRFRGHGNTYAASRAEKSAHESERHAKNLRHFLIAKRETPGE